MIDQDLVGEPKRELEPTLVEQEKTSIQRVLVPCAELSELPAESTSLQNAIRHHRGPCRDPGTAAASRPAPCPAEGNRRLAADCPIAIVEKLCEIVRDVAVTPDARRSSGLEADPGGRVVHHASDRLSRFGATDRVECPECV